jgi:hypothetical protein
MLVHRGNCTCREPEPVALLLGTRKVSACEKCRKWIGHPVHVCLACSNQIMPFEQEIKVESRRREYYDVVIDQHPYGHWVPPVRYRHELDSDCQAAIRKDRFLTPPWPKRTGAAKAVRERKLRGG